MYKSIPVTKLGHVAKNVLSLDTYSLTIMLTHWLKKITDRIREVTFYNNIQNRQGEKAQFTFKIQKRYVLTSGL